MGIFKSAAQEQLERHLVEMAMTYLDVQAGQASNQQLFRLVTSARSLADQVRRKGQAGVERVRRAIDRDAVMGTIVGAPEESEQIGTLLRYILDGTYPPGVTAALASRPVAQPATDAQSGSAHPSESPLSFFRDIHGVAGMASLTDVDVRLLERAGGLIEAGRPQDAETLLRQASTAGDAAATCMLASFRQNVGDVREAVLLWRQSIEAGYLPAAFDLAILLDQQGRPAEAEALYRRAAAGGLPGAMYNLANRLSRQGDAAQAESWYRRAANAGQRDAMFNLARLLEERGQTAGAERWYRQAVDAGLTDALCNLANLLRDRGAIADAEALYRRGVDAGDLNAGFMLATLLWERGDLAEAETLFRRSLDGGDADAVRPLAALFVDRGAVIEADVLLRRYGAIGGSVRETHESD